MPQSEAGWRMEPPVSEPSEAKHSSAATAAAEPPLEPPATWPGFQGFCTTWKAQCSLVEPMANSSMASLPSSTAPASRSRVTTVAS